ncbi:MAG: hypothetical protein OP8BY_1190 [Candidatus Saccharicenans subterraneus]|uniref:Uncharacterized protein n=1 Tax=Candidatus Saccharicenans subterraneus TaxID=2508984 RepID=A0A3E2BPK8_9BACT|nr:MAG: hypothetical protein OP8BY_1190 [Candidatus Saccharicenans subterraneum]
MAEERKILLRLLHIINNNYTESDLEDLIMSMVRLILPLITKQSGLYLKLAGYQPRDIALLTVSPLFIRNRQDRFPVLEKLFNWKIVEKFMVASEADFRRYLRNILARRLKQTFYYLSGEIRPERTKIKREILYALKKLPGCRIVKESGRTQVTIWQDGTEKVKSTLLLDDQADRLLAICLNRGLGGLQVPKFFKKLVEVMSDQGLAAEVSLNTLLEIYIETQKNFLLSEVSHGPVPWTHPETGTSRTDLSNWIEELRARNALLLNRYLARNKIGTKEKAAFLQALDDLLQDWQDGGQEKSLYEYLKKYAPEISSEEYRKEKRKILEYLVKTSRDFLKIKLHEQQTASGGM